MERISLAQVERKAEVLNRDFGLDLSVEGFSSRHRICSNGGSKNLTPLMRTGDLHAALCILEEGIILGRMQKMVVMGTMTGRTSSTKPNFKEVEKDGRPRTESNGE